MKIYRDKLKNNIRVVANPVKDSNSITIFFMIKTGSRNETNDIRGISHFLEHMVFKGTKKRPSALILTKEIEGLGAQLNAFTSKEYTVFYLKTIKSNFEKSVEIISDYVFNPLMKSEDIDMERGVILEEMKRYIENPRFYIDDLFEQTFFDEKRLSREVLGSKEIIKKVKRQDFLNYQNKYYHSGNTVVSLAGNMPDNYLEVLERELSGVRKSDETDWDSEPSGKRKNKNKIKLLNKDIEQTYFILGYPGLKYADEDFLPLSLLGNILGGGMSARLFQEVREKRGLAYEVSSDI